MNNSNIQMLSMALHALITLAVIGLSALLFLKVSDASVRIFTTGIVTAVTTYWFSTASRIANATTAPPT